MSEAHTIVLIGCGKEKLEQGAPARDLYTGPLFKARRRYAEARTDDWFIISARHCLVRPEQWMLPYDTTMNDLDAFGLVTWPLNVVSQLVHAHGVCDLIRGDFDPVVEVHAGAEYAKPLRAVLHAVGVRHVCPLEGLGIGEQLGWYAKHTNTERADKAEIERAKWRRA